MWHKGMGIDSYIKSINIIYHLQYTMFHLNYMDSVHDHLESLSASSFEADVNPLVFDIFHSIGDYNGIRLKRSLFEYVLFKIYLLFLLVNYLLVLGYWKYSYREGRKKWNSCHWNRTGDPTSYCAYDVNLDKIDDLLDTYNWENPNKKITYTHIALKSLGYGMK